MDDVRLKETPFRLDGREYKLRCNFNVIADVVEACGGELPNLFDKRTQLKTGREFLAAMLNDYADEQGWPERYTARQLGRKLGGQVAALLAPVMGLVVSALYARDEDGQEHPKN
jgi:hypothetical protein